MSKIKAITILTFAVVAISYAAQLVYFFQHSYTAPSIQAIALDEFRAELQAMDMDPAKVRAPAGLTFSACSLWTFEVFRRPCGKLIFYVGNKQEEAFALNAIPEVIANIRKKCALGISPICENSDDFSVRVTLTLITRKNKPTGGYSNTSTDLATFFLTREQR